MYKSYKGIVKPVFNTPGSSELQYNYYTIYGQYSCRKVTYSVFDTIYVHCTVLNIFTLDFKQHVYCACNCTLYSTQNMYIVLIKIYVHAMYKIHLHYCTVYRTKLYNIY